MAGPGYGPAQQGCTVDTAKLRRATPPFKIRQLCNVDTGDRTAMYFPGMSGGGGGGSTAGLSDEEAAMVKTVGIRLSQRSLED